MPLSWGFIISHINCVFMYVNYVTVFLLLLLMVILLVILMLVKNSRCPYVGHNSRNHCLIKSCKKFISRILLYVLINSLMTLLLRNLTSFKFLAKYMSFSSIYWSAASFFFLILIWTFPIHPQKVNRHDREDERPDMSTPPFLLVAFSYLM